jgi:hypothetical protein
VTSPATALDGVVVRERTGASAAKRKLEVVEKAPRGDDDSNSTSDGNDSDSSSEKACVRKPLASAPKRTTGNAKPLTIRLSDAVIERIVEHLLHLLKQCDMGLMRSLLQYCSADSTHVFGSMLLSGSFSCYLGSMKAVNIVLDTSTQLKPKPAVRVIFFQNGDGIIQKFCVVQLNSHLFIGEVTTPVKLMSANQVDVGVVMSTLGKLRVVESMSEDSSLQAIAAIVLCPRNFSGNPSMDAYRAR